MSTSTPCSFAGAERGARAAERGAGRTLLLTGASRGIGHATVKIFAEAGWRVITCARRPFDPNCPWESGRIDHVPVDLADPAATGRAVARVKELIGDGPLHALVNNAGISPKTPAGGRLSSVDTPLQTWMDVFHVNFLAPVILARGLLDNLVAAGGSIVNLTSIAGTRVHPFAGAAYATSKAALFCLTREMAFDFAPYGVRVNAIAPGEIRTEILSAETEAHLAPTIPMRRIGTPAEVASVIYFLCSQHASYVTGEEVQINGGQHV